MTIDLKDLFSPETGLNEEMFLAIVKAIKDHNQSDIDYLKFKQSVLNLQKMEMDEPTSIQSAFASLSPMGVTKKRLIDSISHYIHVVNREKEKFAEALKNQIAQQIDKPRLESEKFDDMIEEKQERIKKLEQEIKLIEQRKETIGEELAQAEEKINGTRDQFRTVYEHFSKILSNDSTLIEQVIK